MAADVLTCWVIEDGADREQMRYATSNRSPGRPLGTRRKIEPLLRQTGVPSLVGIPSRRASLLGAYRNSQMRCPIGRGGAAILLWPAELCGSRAHFMGIRGAERGIAMMAVMGPQPPALICGVHAIEGH